MTKRHPQKQPNTRTVKSKLKSDNYNYRNLTKYDKLTKKKGKKWELKRLLAITDTTLTDQVGQLT